MSDENATPDNGQTTPDTASNDNPANAAPDNTAAGGQPEPQGQPDGQQNDTGEAETSPESYALDIPGFEGDAEELQFITDMARDSGLPAQAAGDFLQRVTDYQRILHQKKIEDWEAQSHADTEFGGAQFDASMAIAKKGYKMFASDGMKNILEKTGMGSHPEFIRLFYNIGKLMNEDGMVSGKAGGGFDARQQFPNTPGLNP